jgi:hypothetical protein
VTPSRQSASGRTVWRDRIEFGESKRLAEEVRALGGYIHGYGGDDHEWIEFGEHVVSGPALTQVLFRLRDDLVRDLIGVEEFLRDVRAPEKLDGEKLRPGDRLRVWRAMAADRG